MIKSRLHTITISLLGLALSYCTITCNESETTLKDGEEQARFIAKLNQAGCKTSVYAKSDTTVYYHVESPDSITDQTYNFSWFKFKVKIYSDSTQAQNSFKMWKDLLPPAADLYKSPQYHLRYGRYVYILESGCFNDDKMDSIYLMFRSCLDTTQLNTGGVVKFKCEGIVVPPIK